MASLATFRATLDPPSPAVLVSQSGCLLRGFLGLACFPCFAAPPDDPLGDHRAACPRSAAGVRIGEVEAVGARAQGELVGSGGGGWFHLCVGCTAGQVCWQPNGGGSPDNQSTDAAAGLRRAAKRPRPSAKAIEVGTRARASSATPQNAGVGIVEEHAGATSAAGCCAPGVSDALS